MNGGPATFRLSHAGIAPSLRREIAMEVAGRAITNLDFTPLQDDLEFEVTTRILPGIVVTDAQTSAFRAVSGYDPSRDNDDFALWWNLSRPKARAQQFGKDFVSDGSAILLSCADRMAFEHLRPIHHVTVRLRRSLLAPLLPDVDTRLMQPISRNNKTLRLLNTYLDGYRPLHDAGIPPELAHSVAIHIADLVALAVGTNRDMTHLAAGRGLRAARLDAAKRWVLANLRSPVLSIRTAAMAAEMSERTMQQLFRGEGTTFTDYVLRERLALAHRALSTPRFGKWTISEIAYDCGFGDLSHFTRSFRRVYGETPSDVRNRAVAARY